MDYAVFFVVFMVLILFGGVAFFRVVGVAVVVHGIAVIIRREVAFGWEGREPSFYLLNWAAIAAGLMEIILGFLVIIFAPSIVCALDQSKGC